MEKGRLIIFEGPDHVGKTTISRHFYDWLASVHSESDVQWYAFPGKEEGTLGDLIYDFHHRPYEYVRDDRMPGNLALQTLHVAAHIDAVLRKFKPWYDEGKIIILDRSYLSTLVYGLAAGIDGQLITNLVSYEESVWKSVGIEPDCIFFIDRGEPIPDEKESEFDMDHWKSLRGEYLDIAAHLIESHPIRVVPNEGTVKDAVAAVIGFWEMLA